MPSWGPSLLVVLAEYVVLLVPIILSGLWLTAAQETAVVTCVAVVVSLAVSYLLSLVYSHPAPYMTTAALITGPPENSLPSQHTTVLFASVWPLLLRHRRWLAGLLLSAGVLTGIARIIVGYHYLIDIVGGIGASVIGTMIVIVLGEYVMTISQWVITIEARVRERASDWL